jgi:hypothetical protein
MKLGGGYALNFDLMVEDEYKNCRKQKQYENAPDMGEKVDPPPRPDFLPLLSPGPRSHFKFILSHASKPSHLPCHGIAWHKITSKRVAINGGCLKFSRLMLKIVTL